MGNDRIGVTMAHAVLLLQHGNEFHVLGGTGCANDNLPLRDGPTVLLLDGRKVGCRAFDLLVSHEVQYMSAALRCQSSYEAACGRSSQMVRVYAALLLDEAAASAQIMTQRGRSSEVERQLPKLNVVGSIPIARSMACHAGSVRIYVG